MDYTDVARVATAGDSVVLVEMESGVGPPRNRALARGFGARNGRIATWISLVVKVVVTNVDVVARSHRDMRGRRPGVHGLIVSFALLS